MNETMKAALLAACELALPIVRQATFEEPKRYRPENDELADYIVHESRLAPQDRLSMH